jgi:hypothetical protein
LRIQRKKIDAWQMGAPNPRSSRCRHFRGEAQDRKHLNKPKDFVGIAQQYAFVIQSEGEHRQLHPSCPEAGNAME